MPGLRDIGWFDEHGMEIPPEGWHLGGAQTLALRRAGRKPADGIEVLLLLLNASDHEVTFRLPEPAFTWRLLVDSAAGLVSEERAITGETHVQPSSLRLLAAHAHLRPTPPETGTL